MLQPATDIRPQNWRCARDLVIIAGVLAFCLWTLFELYGNTKPAPASTQEGGKDLQAYRRIVERVHHGEGYYSAAAEELREGGYSSSSIFNWRLPTYAWLFGAFPRPEWAQAVLGLLVLAALVLAYASECRQANVGRAMVMALAMAGAFLWCIDGDAFFAQELWAGVLIAVSVSAFAAARRKVGVAAGLTALFMRELALPYVLISVVLAWREKRWREVAAWCSGLAVFALFFAWHAGQVHGHLTGNEHAESEGWIQFGGPAFLVQTCQMNVWLFNLPAWLGLLYLAASLLGLAFWRDQQGIRVGATVGIYLLAFLIIGKPCNAYWGLLYVALLPFGLVRCYKTCLDYFTSDTPLLKPRLTAR